MKNLLRALVVCVAVPGLALSLDASEEASHASVSLAGETVFALGGVGVAGTMSGGEKDLRALLKESDAVPQLKSLLKKASPAGQLYALLGLRLRDRPAFDQFVPEFRKRTDEVSTAHGCMLMKEKMEDVVKQIEHGDYDAALSREPW